MRKSLIELFPIGAGISEMRGVITLIKEDGGTAYLAQLANQSGMKIDQLLPIIDAARMLGFIKVGGGSITLTESGTKINVGNFQKMIRRAVVKIEPFRSTMELLSGGELSTTHLAKALRRRGIKLSSNKKIDEELLVRMLTKWGMRTRILDYDGRKNRWRAVE